MSKFNTTKAPKMVENHQNGLGVKHTPEMELVGVLATGLDTGKFYENPSDRENRIIRLIKEVGSKNPEFVAKALIYARTKMNQRSVTHVGSAIHAANLSGTPFGSKFFSKRDRKQNKGGVVYRLDDMLEIMAYYQLRNPNKPFPASMKKGFKAALESADEYELAKYKSTNKDISLIDVVNIVHPKPTSKNADAFRKLMEGTLTQFNTAEDKNTRAGIDVANKVKRGEITKDQAKTELAKAKEENWSELIMDNKIGYLALLRNLRNIVEQATDVVFNKALESLTNPKFVSTSLVFPHQIDLAVEVLLNDTKVNFKGRKNNLIKAVTTAYELSIPNLTNLFKYGSTAVVFDTSGSMQGGWGAGIRVNGKSINASPVEKAALIAATLGKGLGADVYHFASSCAPINYNPVDSVNSIKYKFTRNIGRVGHGTSFESIFSTLLGKTYERVFVISDMQGGDSILKNSSYQKYNRAHGKPYIYSIDLTGYGSTMFKQDSKLINLFGYSSDIYEMVKKAEIDPQQIIKEINKIVM